MAGSKTLGKKGGGGSKGGGNPNYPSTTGNPSGGGRGNEPKGSIGGSFLTEAGPDCVGTGLIYYLCLGAGQACEFEVNRASP